MDSGLSITGGMCGDDARFEKPLASYRKIQEGEVVLIGFYGSTLEVSYASYGGWIPFVRQRRIFFMKLMVNRR
jgi:hypothetical protein